MHDRIVGGAHWSIWAIGSVALLFNGAGAVNFISQMSPDTLAAMPESYRAMIEHRPGWATAGFALAVFSGALGCLLLLLKKSASQYFFIASLLGATATMIHTLGMTGSGIGPVGSLIGNLVQLVATALLIWYSRKAERNSWIN